MVNRRSFITGALAALVCLAIGLLGSATAGAQPTCVVTNVQNNTTCTINLCLYDAGGVQNCYTIPPGGPTGIVLGAFNPIGVISAAGNQFAFVAPPLPGCTVCMGLRATAGTCCARVCYDRALCRITITSCGPPCAI